MMYSTPLFRPVLAFCALLPLSCGGAAQHGVVPADLRDVERAGEGLVSTTFGSFPARTPNWTRAQTVFGILKSVWGRSKVAAPGLPAAARSQLDAAIARLEVALPAQNQKDAVMASNAVGLAVPDLFEFFHPDSPKQVVRMDAVFRQVGIDAHFGDWTATAADVASLRADWTSSKAAIHARVPTCHRVGGTATVEGEIEASLTNLEAAIGPRTTMNVEKESENGALEIDTLELLFDCPPDNTVPASGLGAKCTTTASCDPGQVCDLTNAGGKCAPSPAQAAIGTRCGSTVDCGTDPRSACATESGDGYPGGYCSMEPCDDVHICPPGATCVAIGNETPACFKSCSSDADCRASEGYVCQLFVTTPPDGFGPTNRACAFRCSSDDNCKSPLKCDVTAGLCRP